ncbi:MAG: caspase family protein, partial [Deltaproteobacteria bacterium]|nr:caspase family protein [Deltaproteobacteria bacterium]
RPWKLVAQAENHALLIGIGKYKYTTLEGPPHDVAALRQILIDRYDFKKGNIHSLVNQEAIKSRILHELQLLTRRTRPGDGVFIYFSGHGTSRRDELMALPLPHTTGALVPADFSGDLRKPVATLMSELIIGQRDLRPTLEQLDRDRRVLMVFDTCFSGNTVRAIGTRRTADSNRYMVLPSKRIMISGRKSEVLAESHPPDEAYPYRNIFYISAASENEVAKDIRTNSLHVYPTIDGKPHGVLTDALLRVLAGKTPVDTNHDGQWSQIELFKSVKAEVRRRFRQTPQMLPRAGKQARRLHARTFFTRPSGGHTMSSETMAANPTPKGLPPAAYQPEYSSSHALVVGINRYRHWPHLEYAARDAIEMAAILEAKGFRIHMLTDEQATLRNILSKLKEIRTAVDGNSRVVFYFAGHGQTEDLPGGGERGYIVPVDADGYDWQGTMLPMDQLNQLIKEFRAKHIFMAFDSCYSGLGLTRSIKLHPPQDAAYVRKMMRSRSIQILTAGSRSEQAIEVGGHGLFTNHLLAALSGSADINKDGYITATEIYATLRPSITKKSHSRQTPQFGYIEGNGDIIFVNAPPQMQSATVLLETALSGIDVWAGTSEIGHRLSAGRHKLRARAGQTTIIVKKGGRTLFHKIVLLPANGKFAISIGATGQQSRPREAFTTLTIANRNVDNYSNSIARDLDGDGREEIVTAAGKYLYAFNSDGAVVWERKFDFPVTLNLIDDWNLQPAIGLTAVNYNKAHLLLLNASGKTIWQHTRKITRYHRGNPDGGAMMAKLADIDRDGRKEVIALATAKYTLKPRGVIVYDQDAEELWRYTIGPNQQNIVVWEKDQGRPDIIIGTFSPGDGNTELHNNTSDLQAYVISVDGYGKTNWVTRVGEYYTGVRVMLADREGYGRPSLYAHKYTSFRFRGDKGAIFRFSKSGDIVDRFETGTSIMSIAAAPAASKGDRAKFLYAADNKNNLFKLDHNLNLLQKKSLNSLSESKSKPMEIRLVGVHDYDGDGSRDLLLYSFRMLLSDRNPLTVIKPDHKVFYSDLKFQIVSHDFSRLIKSVSLADEWKKWKGFAVIDLDRPETAYYPFMALSDKIAVYNY